ncbi:MAG TPA: S24 family peptidase [Candidatus Babeliales bacterium]|nr:S24 family peptidase [Candidatus Babeliales bacterium]
MNTWTGRLKSKMKELGLTQEELARKLGVTRSAVAHYVQGTRQPPLKQMVKLAGVLKVDPSWLQFGKAQDTATSAKQQSRKALNRIPVLEWQQAVNYNPEDSHEKTLEYFSCIDTECYALQIKGDSMVSSLTQSVSFNPGSYVIVDPNKQPEHGSFVISTASTKKDTILRQYVEEGGVVYLKPLNPQYPLIQMERSTKILGVVIANIQLT